MRPLTLTAVVALAIAGPAWAQQTAPPGDPGSGIVVRQRPPAVAVETQPPQVTVEPGTPEVGIRQSPPDVTVRTVRPQVTLQRGEPRVDVSGGEQAEVQVRPPPEGVRPQVSQAGQPRIEFRPAPARVSVATSPAQVEFQIIQEPVDVTVERLSAQEGRLTGARMSRRDVLGMPVVDATGRRVGTVRDLTFAPNGSTLDRAVIAVEDGNRLVAVPWTQVEVDTRQRRLALDMPADRVRQARAFSYGEQTRAMVGPRTSSQRNSDSNR